MKRLLHEKLPYSLRENLAYHDVQFCNRNFRNLIDCGNEVNAISGTLATSLGLKVLHTHWGAAKIDESQLTTYGMVLATFSVDDKHGHTRWFEETFLIADVTHDIILGMPFLKLADPEIRF